jgi:hypothetical protein
MISWFPRVALTFLTRIKGDTLYDLAHKDLTFSLSGVPQRDLVSGVNRLSGVVTLKTAAAADVDVEIRVDARIDSGSAACRELERVDEGSAQGHSVLRLGIKRTVTPGGVFTGGSFVGGARLDFDVADGDPDALGGSDFWVLDGTFVTPKAPLATPGACSSSSCKVVAVDTGHLGAEDTVTGTVVRFPSSTVALRAVLTYSGAATADGAFHKHVGIANPAGGSPLLAHFDIPVLAGDDPTVVAARTADLLNRSPIGVDGGGPLLAIQGGTGLGISESDPTSSRVAVCQSVDGAACVTMDDAPEVLREAEEVFPQVGTQIFSSSTVYSFRNSGMGSTFGVLNEAPLVGWLTPFKVIFFTDRPEADYLTAGGSVVIGVNICTSSSGAICDPNTTTGISRLRLPTSAGQTPEEVARAVAKAFVDGGVTCFQRVGATLFMDAGLEMPSVLVVNSEDAGLGYATQAANIPTGVEPHAVTRVRQADSHAGQ